MDETLRESGKRPCQDILSDPKRGRLVFDRNEIFRHPLRFLQVSGPFLTAHHPFCSHYEGHLFTLRGRKWCIGCFFNTLSFFTAFFVMLLIWFASPAILSRFYLFWGGVVGVAISLLSSALHLTKNKKVKGVAKLILGSSFAAICISILIAGGDLFTSLDMKAVIIFMIYVPIITIMNAKRILDTTKECEACEYKMRWSKCPGFEDLICKFVDEGFIYAKPRIEVDTPDASSQKD
ncbi:MAG: hypothetical protein ACW97A_00120 [Candidatus Thorarchaeota archaeon]